MGIFSNWPTITADDLDKMSTAFARELAERLEAFNSDFPRPEMDEELYKAVPEAVLGPNPEQAIGLFRNAFCRYIAARQIIVPHH